MSGSASARTVILTCLAAALILLIHVSSQTYANKLLEDINGYKKKEDAYRAQIGRLTSEYTTKSSRAEVMKYCEEKLGMVQGDGIAFIRISVEEGVNEYTEYVEAPEQVIWSQMYISLQQDE